MTGSNNLAFAEQAASFNPFVQLIRRIGCLNPHHGKIRDIVELSLNLY